MGVHIDKINIDLSFIQKEIMALLEFMGSFGKDPEGGISRFLYSGEWVQVQNALFQYMTDGGLTARFDSVGNLYGTVPGEDSGKTILTGSHIDTVKCGGLFDGQYGIAAGILALKYLKKHYGAPKKNLEVVSIAEEEGSRFPFTYWGSKNIVGHIPAADMAGVCDVEGVSFTDAIHGAGFDYRNPEEPVRNDIEKFLEVHIEQGGVLEHEKKSIGIVETIVGQRRFTVTVDGEANHAGTTPMSYRKDAVKSASELIHLILSLAEGHGDPLVTTVGMINVLPNTTNVVPAKVAFSIDMRHPENAFLDMFTKEIRATIDSVAHKNNINVAVDLWMNEKPVPMNKEMGTMVRDICLEESYSHRYINSGAGHDSQVMAGKFDTAMIFVPSHKGISHSPKEYTSPEDLAKGVVVLTRLLYKLAYLQ